MHSTIDPSPRPSSTPSPRLSSKRPRKTNLDPAQVLEATEACLDELGYDGTTIRQIAQRLDCAVGSIYRHFQDKRALLDAVVQKQFNPVVELIEEGGDLASLVRRYEQIAQAKPEPYRLMFWLATPKPAPESAPINPTTEPPTEPSIQPSTEPSSDAPPPHPAGIPAVVDKIIAGFAARLKDQPAAQQLWAVVHGRIMLGLPALDLPPSVQPEALKPVITVDALGKPKASKKAP